MAKLKIPSTQAIRILKANKIEFKPYFYKYVEHGGTQETVNQLEFDEHRVIKTLIFEDENTKPFIVLMNGDFEVSEKQLARIIGIKSVKIAPPKRAEKYSGYRIGGTSPFGVKTKMKILAQKDIFDFEKIVINGGQRGFLIEISTEDLKKTLEPQIVDTAIKN